MAELKTLLRTEHVDPVCGMTVDPARAAGSLDYRGRTYYFCHPRCLDRFKADPEKFLPADPAPALPGSVRLATASAPLATASAPLAAASAPPAGASPTVGAGVPPAGTRAAEWMKVEYTCPMHPEIIRDQPA